jgi:hypothetical protein
MVVIFGFGDGRSKDLGPVAPATCANCHNDVFLHEVQSEQQFSLYFVPLGSYNKNEYLLCPICHSGVNLRPGDTEAVKEMRASTSLLRRGTIDPVYYRTAAEQFWARIAAGPGGHQSLRVPETLPGFGPSGARPPSAAPPPAAAQPAPRPNIAQQIAELSKLRDAGTLTEAEFAAAKKKILGV